MGSVPGVHALENISEARPDHNYSLDATIPASPLTDTPRHVLSSKVDLINEIPVDPTNTNSYPTPSCPPSIVVQNYDINEV